MDPACFTIDLAAVPALLSAHDIPLTLLAASFIPFPLPIAALRAIIDESGTSHILVYDGSQVLGLIAQGAFQHPLADGADILIGSTHKSCYGPQGGLVLTNSKRYAAALRDYLALDIASGIGLVDNVHVNRVAALGVALEELRDDTNYAERVIRNARTLARALDEAGVPVRFAARGYTASHQLFLDLTPARAERFCRALETVGIFIDTAGRLGVAEVTHRGYGRTMMERVAGVIADVYRRGPTEGARAQVRAQVRELV